MTNQPSPKPPNIQVTLDGAATLGKEDLQQIRDAVNADIERFNPYVVEHTGNALAPFETTLLRSYIAWKLVHDQKKEEKNGD